ncbi:MAG: hypothetical protein EOP81_02235 [Variovorax sp.]|nr:MAG: hypothetical protein EOP81_02235 [Variovorax sp.]
MLTWNEKNEAIQPTEVNPMATDWNDSGSLSMHVELRNDDAVQAAAAALQARLADINAQSGIQLAVAEAVKRLSKSKFFPTAERVREELEDMLGEACIYAEKVSHAGRVEDRAAAYLKTRRSCIGGLVASRISEIDVCAPDAQSDEAQVLAIERRALTKWLQEPWRHPVELGDNSNYFFQLYEDPGCFDPSCEESDGAAAVVGAAPGAD